MSSLSAPGALLGQIEMGGPRLGSTDKPSSNSATAENATEVQTAWLVVMAMGPGKPALSPQPSMSTQLDILSLQDVDL